MTISWFGLAYIRLTLPSAARGEDMTLVCDPFDPRAAGAKLPKHTAEVVCVSDPLHPLHNASGNVRGRGEREPFVVNSPGEYEVGGLMIYGIPAWGRVDKGASRRVTIYRITGESLTVVLGGAVAQSKLTDEQLERLEHVDVMILPLGAQHLLHHKEAIELVNQIEPRVVIPIPFVTERGAKSADVEKFIKELGLDAEAPVARFKCTKKDLPQGEMKLVLLTQE